MTGAKNFLLTAITRDPCVVRAADAAGVDRIGIDIERLGKADRQGSIPGARISDHSLDDLPAVAAHVTRAELFIRVNPIHDGSRAEIDRAIALGAGAVMLPYFTTADEAASFVGMIDGRASPVLLVETASAAAGIDEIVRVGGVAEIMVGLNDLHMSLGLPSHFDVVVSDLMETIAAAVRGGGMRFGFGGLARVDDAALPVPPDLVCAQYPRLGATSAWLSRSFFRGLARPFEIDAAVRTLRARLSFWADQPPSALAETRDRLTAVLGGLHRAER
ncbi:MAG: aldolase/citrate lyase family protein [Candidatus Rokuibacteriota bacterium]